MLPHVQCMSIPCTCTCTSSVCTVINKVLIIELLNWNKICFRYICYIKAGSNLHMMLSHTGLKLYAQIFIFFTINFILFNAVVQLRSSLVMRSSKVSMGIRWLFLCVFLGLQLITPSACCSVLSWIFLFDLTDVIGPKYVDANKCITSVKSN